MLKKIAIWFLAMVITAAAAYYQRKTGPTHPKSVTVTLADNTWDVSLLRSNGARDARIKLPMIDPNIKATLYYKKFRFDEDWKSVEFEVKPLRGHPGMSQKKSNKPPKMGFVAYLPQQDPAGKLEYYIELSGYGDETYIAKDAPVVIRFKGDVPAGVLIPHILFMFLSMLLATVAGMYAIFKIKAFRKLTYWTFGVLFIGGFILGPWVQWYAFGDWWTGIPFGWDLTDNKTLFAFLFWIAAVIGNRKKSRPGLVILAAVMTLVIFSIPHSLFGSELDYATGEVTQG
jgi:hypothetical protein